MKKNNIGLLVKNLTRGFNVSIEMNENALIIKSDKSIFEKEKPKGIILDNDFFYLQFNTPVKPEYIENAPMFNFKEKGLYTEETKPNLITVENTNYIFSRRLKPREED